MVNFKMFYEHIILYDCTWVQYNFAKQINANVKKQTDFGILVTSLKINSRCRIIFSNN